MIDRTRKLTNKRKMRHYNFAINFIQLASSLVKLYERPYEAVHSSPSVQTAHVEGQVFQNGRGNQIGVDEFDELFEVEQQTC